MNEAPKDGKPGAPCGPMIPLIPSNRREAIVAVKLWACVTLSLTGALGAFTIWHLVRRGRLLRERSGPIKPTRPLELPEPEVADPT